MFSVGFARESENQKWQTVILNDQQYELRTDENRVLLTDENQQTHQISSRINRNGEREYFDTISYFNPPDNPEQYNDYVAGYQTGGGYDCGDTVICWFSLLGDGTVLSMSMQNESSGEAECFFAGPAMIFVEEEGWWFYNPPNRFMSFNEMLLIPLPVPIQCDSHDPEDQFDENTNWDPRWNTFDLTAFGFEFFVTAEELGTDEFNGVPEIWAGYVTNPNDDYGPHIWQDENPYDEIIHSLSTLHEYTGLTGSWYNLFPVYYVLHPAL